MTNVSGNNQFDNVNVNQNLNAPPKASSGEPITVKREKIQPADTSFPDVSQMSRNVITTGEGIPIQVGSMGQVIKNLAANELFQETGHLSPGREKLLSQIISEPVLFENDLPRVDVSIGENSHLHANTKDPQVARDFFADHLTKYIAKSNEKLKVSDFEIDKILYCTSQFLGNDIEITRSDVFPRDPWILTSKPVLERKVEFEKRWFRKPEVLIVSQKLTKTYINSEKPEAKPKNIEFDAKIMHNLVTKEVEFKYKLTIDGTSEEWDPTKNYTAETFKELHGIKDGDTLDLFKQKIGLDNYEKMKSEIPVINENMLEHIESLRNRAQKSEGGSLHILTAPNDASPRIIKLLTANGKYGLTVTKNGDAFIEVPINDLSRGGDQKNSYLAVQLFSNGQSLARKNEPSKFEYTVLPDIKSSQIGLIGEDLDLEGLSYIDGERKVLANITDFTNILKPHTINIFKIDGSKNTSNPNGILMQNYGNVSLKNKIFDLNEKSDFENYKRHASNMISAVNEFHNAGLYHRQINPSNFLIQYGAVKLTNFIKVTSKNEVDIPHEQLQKDDLYSLGVSLFEMSHGPVSKSGAEIDGFIKECADKMPNSQNDQIILGLLNVNPSIHLNAQEALEKLQKMGYVGKSEQGG